MANPIYGIDLGTTNSSIARLENGRAVALPVEEGQALVPSVVSYDEAAQQVIVGRQARRRQAAFPHHTIRSVKRLMGQNSTVTLGSQHFTPEEISSFILNYLAFQAGKLTGEKIKKVVITVPAYFNDVQRRATIKAGELAGLEVVRIINEPTAAALVYDYASMAGDQSPYILVYDLGGGTFDVSILEVKGEIKEVLASSGDTALGGDDFDRCLVELFQDFLLAQVDQPQEWGLPVQMRLQDIAEQTKVILSDQPFCQVAEAAVWVVDGKPLNLRLEVSRQQLESLTAELMNRTISKVFDALQEAALSPADIGKILLVGGATRMPMVATRLQEIFHRPIFHAIDPDLCVAMGAAVQGGLISGAPLGHILLDVTAHTLGIKTIDQIDPDTGEADYFSPIIRRNSRIPTRQAEVYYTVVNCQESVTIEVFQGENSSCRRNVAVGSFTFPLKPAPPKSPVIVEFAYDPEGLVHITVEQKDKQNRKEVTLDIRHKRILPDDSEEQGQESLRVVNYIVEKATRLLQAKQLPQEEQQRLQDLVAAYAEALQQEASGPEVDALEDELLATLEEMEERLPFLEQG